MKPKVSVIVVNFNGRKFLKDCFSSLMNLDYPKSKLEIIMVDNGSLDKSIEFVKENFPKVKILKNDVNNYCRANNLGIKHARGEYIALLNNDTKVDSQWLNELIQVMEKNSRTGATTGKILFPNGKIQGTAHQDFPNFYWADRGFKEKDRGQYNKIEEVSSISHCAALYRKRCLDEVGLLDEDFNMFVEDVDLSIRAKQRGWRLFYIPTSVAYHRFHGSADEERVVFYCERNRLLLLAKHYPLKLSDELFGKGYFTILNNKNELLKILADVFAKLIKHHNVRIVFSVLPNLFDSLNKILNLEKDYLIKQLDSLKSQLNLLQNDVSQKDKLLQERLTETSNLISQKEEHLLQKSEQISQKDQLLQERLTEVTTLKEQINQAHNLIASKDQELRQKDAVISKLNNFINQIYHSETYRFIARPLWYFLDFIKGKGISGVAHNEEFRQSKNYRNNLCFAYFSAESQIAKLGGNNRYNLKITNDSPKEETALIKIQTESNGAAYSYFTKLLSLQPFSSQEISIDYDWANKIIFYIDGNLIPPDELYKRNFSPLGFYALNTLLFDSKGNKIDTLNIFQKVEI